MASSDQSNNFPIGLNSHVLSAPGFSNNGIPGTDAVLGALPNVSAAAPTVMVHQGNQAYFASASVKSVVQRTKSWIPGWEWTG